MKAIQIHHLICVFTIHSSRSTGSGLVFFLLLTCATLLRSEPTGLHHSRRHPAPCYSQQIIALQTAVATFAELRKKIRAVATCATFPTCATYAASTRCTAPAKAVQGPACQEPRQMRGPKRVPQHR